MGAQQWPGRREGRDHLLFGQPWGGQWLLQGWLRGGALTLAAIEDSTPLLRTSSIKELASNGEGNG